MTLRIIFFLLLNFGALAIGGIFTGKGVPSEWYVNLVKAPWTPPGWMFGFAWTTIMICFAIFMSFAYPVCENKSFLIILYSLQWILNISWNPLFFYYQNTMLSMIVIALLTILMGIFMLFYWAETGYKTILVLPYFIWLIIASSLNAYILLKN